jgi:hypothetical protein
VCREKVRERHGVVAPVSRAPKSSVTLPRRYKIRQVLDYGVIGAELLEVSLVKLAPAVRVMTNNSRPCFRIPSNRIRRQRPTMERDGLAHHDYPLN